MAVPAICSIPGCNKPHRARGWCSTHYDRWRNHGDPLTVLRTHNGEPDRFYHDVVLTYRGNECLLWPFARDSNGYGRIVINGRLKSVHRMVCEEFNGAPTSPSHEAAHSCGNGHVACCTPGHLVWKTKIENEADKLKHGTTNRGARCGTAKLTENQVQQIIDMKGRLPQKAIAMMFCVSGSLISQIHNGIIWSHIPRT